MNQKLRQHLQAVIGSQIINIFYQPTRDVLDDNILVINFGEEKTILYSLHVSCFVRVTQGNKILLTTSDEFFSKNYEKLEGNIEPSINNSLLYLNLTKLREKIKTKKVVSISISPIGDIRIHLQNSININVYLDCLYKNYEYYRFINFQENCQDIISFKNGGVLHRFRKQIQ